METSVLTEEEQQQLELARKFLDLAEKQAMQAGRCPSHETLKQVQVARNTIQHLEKKLSEQSCSPSSRP